MMTFSSAFTVTVPLLLLLLLLSLQMPQAEAENVYLYRLKKLRNSFHTQIEDQVATNDDLIEQSYGGTVQVLVAQISKTQQEAVAEITDLMLSFAELDAECESLMPHRPTELFTMADNYLQGCIVEAEEGGQTISAYVIKDIEKFQSRSNDFSLWFMTSYLSDMDAIVSESHYNAVYNELSAQVVEWDNVDSIQLFQFRQQVIKQLTTLSAAIDECTLRMKDFIAAEFDAMLVNALKCR